MDTTTYSDAVTEFKRQLLIRELHAHAGNRTATARALGLQRNAGFWIMSGPWPDAGSLAASRRRASA